MSGGPTLTGENCKTALNTNYVNISLTREDWCDYKWKCKINNLPYNKNETCLLCKYRKPLDIPKILREATRRKNNGSTGDH